MADTEIEWTREFARDSIREALAKMIDDATPGLAARLASDPAGYSQLLAICELAAQEAEELTRETAISARQAGVTWERIGEALGISRQAAQQRFGPQAVLREAASGIVPGAAAPEEAWALAEASYPAAGGAQNGMGAHHGVGAQPAVGAHLAAGPHLPPVGTQAHISEAADSGLLMLSRAGQYGWRTVAVSPGGTFTLEFTNHQWQVVTTANKAPAGLDWTRIGRFGFTVYWTRPSNVPILPGAPDVASFKSARKLDRDLRRRALGAGSGGASVGVGVAGSGVAAAGAFAPLGAAAPLGRATLIESITDIADSITDWLE